MRYGGRQQRDRGRVKKKMPAHVTATSRYRYKEGVVGTGFEALRRWAGTLAVVEVRTIQLLAALPQQSTIRVPGLGFPHPKLSSTAARHAQGVVSLWRRSQAATWHNVRSVPAVQN